MITVDSGSSNHVEITVAAPITVDDLTAARDQLVGLAGTQALRRVLVFVRSIGLPKPKALWEDLKLAPLVKDIRFTALVTDIEWYAHLSEFAGAVWPGLTIKHFEPGEETAARAWLAAQSDG
jgi:stage II sporulation SpoAA-like protein